MKNFVILLLLVFSIITIPFAFSQEEVMTVTTDKEVYVYGEDVTISGTGYLSEDLVGLVIIENNLDIQIGVDNEGNFSAVLGSHNFSVNGIYTIIINTVNYHPLAMTTFQYGDLEPTNPLTLQTDKEEYYAGDYITINGTISEIDWSADTTITYNIDYSNEIIQTGDGGTLQSDGTFSFMADTTQWDYTGSSTVTVTIQNHTADTDFYYNNTPNMTPEALYEMNMEQYDMLEEHDTIIENQQLDIVDVQTNIDDVKNELTLQNQSIGTLDTRITTQNQSIDSLDTRITAQNNTINQQNEIILSIQNTIDRILNFLNLG